MAGKQKETYKSSTEAEDRYQKNVDSGKERWSLGKQNSLATARQQRDLERANRMLEEGPPKGIGMEEMKKRLEFMADAKRQVRIQRELDEALKANEERAKANEMRRETRGVKPTPSKDRADMAAHSYGRGIREQNPELSRILGGMKKGGAVKKYAKGGTVSASRRADGIAQRGKTKGRMV